MIHRNCSSPVLNELILIQEGGAVTIFQSRVNGRVILMHNFADNGGAIFVLESEISMMETL